MDDARVQLQPYVRPGEQLLWWGRPDPSVHFTGADVFLIPFSVLWFGGSVVWVYQVATGEGSLPFALFGVPFVVLGLYMMVGRFFFKARRKRQTAYGVTTERILVAVGDTSLSDSPIRHQPVALKRSRDGTHLSVVIGRSSAWSGPSTGNTGMEFLEPSDGGPVGLYDVADVDGLTRALDRARAS